MDSLQKQKFEKSDLILNELQKFKNYGTYQFVIYETLKSYIYLFKNKKKYILNLVFDLSDCTPKLIKVLKRKEKNDYKFFTP